jgi:hypothetical protein
MAAEAGRMEDKPCLPQRPAILKTAAPAPKPAPAKAKESEKN